MAYPLLAANWTLRRSWSAPDGRAKNAGNEHARRKRAGAVTAESGGLYPSRRYSPVHGRGQEKRRVFESRPSRLS
jgi:hypothetical protein